MKQEILDFAKKAVEIAGKKGAGSAEAYSEWGKEFSVTTRDGEVETLSQATSAGVGLRVINDGHLGFGYTSDVELGGVEAFVDRILAMSKETAKDENNALPSGTMMEKRNKTPNIYDEAVVNLPPEWTINAALEMEKVARAADKRIVTVAQVGGGNYIYEGAIVTSGGLVDSYRSTHIWLFAVPFAQDESGGQRDYWQDTSTHLSEIDTPEQIAKIAAERTVRMLGATKIPSGNMPVVFDPQMAQSFVGDIVGAINGDLVYKKASFLGDKLGKKIAGELLTVVDDGLRDKGTGSAPFDGEGVPTGTKILVDKGILTTFLYDTYTANKAKAKTTASARRGYNSLPGIGTFNLYTQPGQTPPEEILKSIDHGLYVTKMMGSGVNTVNGDFSRGANGFLIEKGELTKPVQEVTVAGNMLEMLGRIDAVGNDLDFRGSGGAPTIRFSELSVSGK